MKPAVGAMGVVSFVMIVIVLITEGFSVGGISSILIADALLAGYLVAVFKLRDYRVAHVPSARAAYEVLLSRDKRRDKGETPPSATSPESLRLLLAAATVAPLATGVIFGVLLGDIIVGLASGVIMAVAAVAAWGWWLWRPES
ncbi:MAG TPA: hypothetical protein VEZ14_06680 [Dehalococcoidia bacterium]|nr:hypothetical protein [Dehalococcoidia bacterium]